jgi:hypothetical protein
VGKPRRRTAGYLLRRRSGCYFRFRLPTEIQSILGREEIRFSLLTTNTDCALERIGVVLPHLFAIRRLSKHMKELTAEEARRAATFAVGRLINTLNQSRAAWEYQDASSSPGLYEDVLSREAFGFAPEMDPDYQYPGRTDLIIHAIQRGEHGDGVPLAKQILKTLKISGDEHSEQFRLLALEMSKLRATLRQVVIARARNDFLTEQRLLSVYAAGNNGSLASLPDNSDARVGPSISDAWQEYAAEKTKGLPRPTWKAKTAAGQQAMFLEFKEIVGDIAVGHVTREVILQYRDAIARVPANRHKRYPGKTIAELLDMDIAPDQLPTARTRTLIAALSMDFGD